MDNCEVIVQNVKTRRVVKTFRSDGKGGCKIDLPPGKYIIFPEAEGYTNNWITDKAAVTIWCGFYSETRASFNNGF